MKKRIIERIIELREMQADAETLAERAAIQAEIIRLQHILDSM